MIELDPLVALVNIVLLLIFWVVVRKLQRKQPDITPVRCGECGRTFTFEIDGVICCNKICPHCNIRSRRK